MNEFWKNHKVAAVLAAYVAVALPVVAFSAYWLFGQIRGLSDGIQQSMADDRIEKNRLAGLDSMKALAGKVDGDKEAIDSIIDESQEVDFIKSLEGLAEECGLEIKITADDQSSGSSSKGQKSSAKDSQPSIIDGLSHKKRIMLTVGTSGSYSNTFSFIRKLENGRYWANVVSISLKKSAIEPESSRQSSAGGIFFAAPGSSSTPDRSSDEGSSASEKETLVSSLAVAVYLK